ncbi:uncharacterized protein L203_104960 [Cryptococcus depauperatus CBS 7841]|uniref:Uncharacterized protein n=1 Tax=Cryptococcus depauperatus CBS 7841 TaxID=1295531 RepID=A0AAJ8M2P8_9TREE
MHTRISGVVVAVTADAKRSNDSPAVSRSTEKVWEWIGNKGRHREKDREDRNEERDSDARRHFAVGCYTPYVPASPVAAAAAAATVGVVTGMG